jgi:hypothetical protein
MDSLNERSNTRQPRPQASRHATLASALRWLTTLDAASFGVGSVAHLGGRIPLGVATLAEPRIMPATIVEGLCGLALATSAWAQFTRKPWAWAATVGAHGFALGGVLLGMGALAAGRGPRTQLNDGYHLTMVVVLSASLAVLSSAAGKAALGDGHAA